jgi:flagellar basal body-associated protein FliL
MKVQLQLSDAAYRPIAANNSSRLRNAIIACLKDQPVRSISCAEGKSRLKGRIIRKANQTVGKNIFKHLYFNEFVLLGRENTMRLQPVMVIGRSAVKREL